MFSLTKFSTLVLIFHTSIAKDYVLNNKRFPKNFIFGVESAAYNNEGGWNEDGKSQNIWDNAIHRQPNLIKDLTNGDVTCDSYHKYKEDVAMLKTLGANFYRFSFSWSRILPNGFADKINPAGVTYYKNLIKELKDNGIDPHASIYVWDLPQSLQDLGGFLNESIIDWYADFARVCFQTFGDDVKLWITFIEPREICTGGYGLAYTAPFINSEAVEEYLCAHNLLRAHAKAWHIYDEEFRPNQGGKIGVALDSSAYIPASDSTEDKIATETRYQFELGIYASPIFHGDYPDIMKTRIAARSRAEGREKSRLPEFTEKEKASLKGAHDFFGLNVYTAEMVQHLPESPVVDPPSRWADQGVLSSQPSTWKNTSAEYVKVEPWTVRHLLRWIQGQYNDTDILITENGYPDTGGLKDTERISYIRQYLSHIRDAMLEDRVKILGYTVWTLMDNFQWTSGFTERYGLYDTDFDSPNRTRTPKLSAEYYTKVCHTRCLVDTCID